MVLPERKDTVRGPEMRVSTARRVTYLRMLDQRVI